MSKVIVDIAGHKPYDVRIATGAIEGLGAALRPLCLLYTSDAADD